MSPNAISERIARLEQRGVIQSYGAHLNPEALGYAMLVIVGLQTLHGPLMEDTVAKVLAIPEVEAAHVVTGQWDLVLLVRVRDHRHLERVLIDEVWRLQAFRHSETMICLRSHAQPGGWQPVPLRSPAKEEAGR